MNILGSICFGLVIGWITYRTLRRNEGEVQLSDIASVIGAVGGAAVTTVFDDDNMFAGYCIGLAVGFFAYFLVGLFIGGKESASRWMVTD
jgi:uncharacterized membrane protein YeaQ/YmgE (transglycosylase-associated protein family)